MSKLSNKVAIVTGAGQGIRRVIALALAKKGAAITIAENNPDTCVTTAEEIQALGGRSLPIVCDVRKRDQVNAVVESTTSQFGTVDILVNNAQAMRQNVSF